MSNDNAFVDDVERARAKSDITSDFYAKALEASKQFRADYKKRTSIVKSHEMPMERTADGLIKHIVNEGMNTTECCVDIYMQFIPPNKATGTSRHLTEEVAFVIEGSGYDLHWDVKFQCADEFIWEWESKPKKFEWGPGDFIYIPPYCAHKRFNAERGTEARVVVVNSRMMKAIGFDWFDQLEPAEGFEDLWVPPRD
jgi:uncharacterized RmlC-like cupin family protein